MVARPNGATREVFDNADCKTVIVDGELYDRVAALREPLQLRHVIVLDGGRDGALVLAVGANR